MRSEASSSSCIGGDSEDATRYASPSERASAAGSFSCENNGERKPRVEAERAHQLTSTKNSWHSSHNLTFTTHSMHGTHNLNAQYLTSTTHSSHGSHHFTTNTHSPHSSHNLTSTTRSSHSSHLLTSTKHNNCIALTILHPRKTY